MAWGEVGSWGVGSWQAVGSGQWAVGSGQLVRVFRGWFGVAGFGAASRNGAALVTAYVYTSLVAG